MALTKVSGDFIDAGSITQGHLHSSHGITTTHIAEGDKLFFTNARVDSRIGSLSSSDLSEGTNLYYTDARADARIAAADTGDLSEGTNLYYTQARFNSAFTAKSTSDLSEGTNLYYTDARADARITAASTSDLSEGTNLYYTDARADARITAADTDSLSEGSTNLYYTDARADARVALIVDSAPSTLDTLNELAAALGDDANFSTTITTSIGTKWTQDNAKITNWDTAYGWGDHASGGYLTSSTGFPKGADIGGSENLNNYTTTGYYHQNGNAGATSGSNYPANIAGMLTVTNDGVMVYQIYQGYGVNHTYERKYYNGTWNSWHLIYDSGVFTNNSANWNTAYGWGDHGLSAQDKTDIGNLSGTNTGDQDLSGYATSATTLSGYGITDAIQKGVQIASGASWTTATRFGSTGDLSQAAGNHALSVRSENNNDAFMSFHIGSDYAVHFGLDGASNRMHVGGWSDGTGTQYQLYDSRDFSVASVLNSNVTLASLGAQASGSYLTTSGKAADSHLLDGMDHTQFGATLATYGTTAGSSGRVRCTAPFNTNSGKMFQVMISLYGSYTQHTYIVSAYMYSTTNQWYSPQAVYLGTGSPDIVVGRDANGKAYISIANGNYMGVRVHNMTRGYQTSVADTYDPWTISITGGTENSVTPSIYKTWTSGNDGSGSGLDADLLDGQQASAFAPAGGSYGTDWYGNSLYHDDWVRNHTNNNGHYWSSTGWHLYPKDGDDFYLRSGSGSCGLALTVGNETARGYVYANTSSEIGFLDNTRSWALRVDNSGNTFATTSHRAPIFYDNDTNYYFDGNGTSVLSKIWCKGASTNTAPRWDTSFHVAQSQHFYGHNSTQTLYFGESNPAQFGSSVTVAGVIDANGGHGGINITSTSILSSASSTWTGNPGGAGKIQYHSNRWYIVSDSSSNRIVQFRRDGSDVSYIDNSGRLMNAPDLRVPVYYDTDTTYYGDFASRSRLNELDFNHAGYYIKKGDWGPRIQSPYGWIQFGPANGGHAHIYTDRSNFYFNALLQVNGGSTINTSDIRANLFYDKNDTAYYADFASHSHFNTMSSAGGLLFGSDYGVGVTGLYTSTRIQTIFNMGASYKLPNNGASTGSAYGLYWSHQNAGSVGGANNLASHGIIILEGGTYKGSWGGGRLVTPADIRGTIFYDYNNTGYYVNPDSSSNIVNLTVANTISGSITRTAGTSGYGHPGTGMWAFYNWGGSNGGGSAPTGSSYTTGISIGSHPGDQAYGWQMANNMWNAGVWYRTYNSGFSSWYKFLDNTTNTQTINASAYVNGDLGVGFNSGSIGGKLNIKRTTAGISIKNDLGGSLSGSTIGLHNYTSASMNSGGYHLVFQATPTSGSDTNMLLCNINGNLRNRNNSYGQYSDRNIKENITDATPKLEDVKKLQVRNFNFIGDDLKQIGLIAQETELVFPGLVENDLNPQGDMVKSLKYSVLVPILVKAMQEQQTIIDDLKSRLETLENQ